MKNPKSRPTSDIELEGFEDMYSSTSESPGIWAEPQLYLLPFCVPQDRTTERFRQIKITETIKVNNEIRHRSFLVNPHPELGLPGSFELEVMTGIYRLADIQSKNTGRVPEFIELGTFRSFLESIGRPGNGKYIKMLKEGLRRLAGTICISEGFFYSKPRNLFVVESFTFISGLQIAGETDFNSGTFDSTRVKLHEYIRENLDNNFRTLIDFDQLRTFKTDIAKTLSMHIAYRVFKNKSGEWIVDYKWLTERLAIKTYDDPSSARKQLKPALMELRQHNYLETWEWLDGGKIRFIAGPQLAEIHKRRVQAKDAWLIHEQEKLRREKLVSVQPARTHRELVRKEAHDPLVTICTEYAGCGWAAVAQKAHKRGLSEEIIRAEAIKRGIPVRPA